MTGFKPMWASPPGDTIMDIMLQRNISISEFSINMEMSLKFTRDLLTGIIPIDDLIAFKLSTVLGATPEFWVNRDVQYRESLKRINGNEKSNT